MKTKNTQSLALLLTFTCLVASATLSHAAALYWWPGNTAAGPGGTGTWANTVDQWSTNSSGEKVTPGSVPGTSDDLHFGGTFGTVTLAANYDIKSVNVTTTGYTFETNLGRTITADSFVMGTAVSATFRSTATSGNQILTFDLSGTTVESVIRGTVENGLTGGTMAITKRGGALLDMSGVAFTNTGNTIINGGTLRLRSSGPNNLSSGSLQMSQVAGGGESSIIEFVRTGDGTFSRDIGSGVGRILLGAASGATTNVAAALVGFGALDGDVTITTGTSTLWGTGDMTRSNGIKSQTLQLGTTTSTGTTIYTTDLELRVTTEVPELTLRSANGSAFIDGDYTGSLTRSATGTTSSDSVLNRNGTGTLRLSGNSSAFNMRLNQQSGTTLVDGTLASNTTNATYGINVASGAVLGGDGAVTFAGSSVNVAGTLMAGRAGGTGQSLTIDSNVNMGNDSILRFGLGDSVGDEDFIVRTGGTWTFQTDQQVELTIGNAFNGGDGFELVRGLVFDPSYDVSQWNIITPSLSGDFTYALGSDNTTHSIYLNAIPEPSVPLLFGMALGVMLIVRRRSLR